MDGKPLTSLVEVDLALPASAVAPQVDFGLVGTIVTAHFVGDRHRIERSDQHISDDTRSTFHLVFMDRGRSTIRQDGRVAEIEQGEFALLDTGRPYRIDVPGPFESRVFAFPKAGLGKADGKLQRVTASPLRQDHALSAFLIPILGRLTHQSARLHPQTRSQLAQNVTDIVATLINDRTLDTPGLANGRDALMSRIKAFIMRNLDRPELSPQSIAAHHNISVRYLHKLFDSEEATLTRWILAARLERCRVDLLQSDRSRTELIPIAVVANRWGFTSAPRFSRVFRSAYGMTPSEWRDAAEGLDRCRR